MFFNHLILDHDFKQLYVEDSTDDGDEGYVQMKSQYVELMTTGLNSNCLPISKCGFHNSGQADVIPTSSIIKKLRKDMIMITIFIAFISALVTTSSFKTSVNTYNLIMALKSTLGQTFSMKTYITVHDSI